MAKVAINGFGRIGRNAFRAYLASQPKDFEVVAINDPLQDLQQSAHLLKYDSCLGELPNEVSHTEDALVVDGKKYHFSREYDPSTCPWSKYGIDIVMECSGVFTEAAKAKGPITAGAKKVLISAPAKDEDITIVLGVNDKLQLGPLLLFRQQVAIHGGSEAALRTERELLERKEAGRLFDSPKKAFFTLQLRAFGADEPEDYDLVFRNKA